MLQHILQLQNDALSNYYITSKKLLLRMILLGIFFLIILLQLGYDFYDQGLRSCQQPSFWVQVLVVVILSSVTFFC